MRLKEDNPPSLIHGLELQGRALASVVSDTDTVSFLVGTQSLRHPNMVYKIILDEESGQLNKRQFRHPRGEVWHIDSCPSDPGLFLSTFGEREGPAGWRKSAAIMRLPETEAGEEEDLREVEVVTDLDSVMEAGKEVTSVVWQPSDSSRLLCLQGDSVMMVDTGEAGPRVIWSSVHSVRGQTRLETGRWNPHRSYHQLATVSGSQAGLNILPKHFPINLSKGEHLFRYFEGILTPGARLWAGTRGQGSRPGASPALAPARPRYAASTSTPTSSITS